MISLQDICSLPIEFDDFENEVHIPTNVHCDSRRNICIESLAHTLINNTINYPEEVYAEYSIHLEEDQEIFDENLKYDLVVIPPGLLGIEFIKSNIFYSPVISGCCETKFSTIVEGVEGTVTVLMQKNNIVDLEYSNYPVVQEGITIDLNPRDKIAIPQGYFYTFVNTTETTIILSRVYTAYRTATIAELGKTKGMAYFCIRKNAKKEFVYNPRFRDIPVIRKITPQENHMPDLGFDLSATLYNLVKIKPEKFLDILS